MGDVSQSSLSIPGLDQIDGYECCGECNRRTPIADSGECSCGGEVNNRPDVPGFGYRHYHGITRRTGYCKACGNVFWDDAMRTWRVVGEKRLYDVVCASCGDEFWTHIRPSKSDHQRYYCEKSHCQQWKYHFGNAWSVEFLECAADGCTELFCRGKSGGVVNRRYCSDGCQSWAQHSRRRKKLKSRGRKRSGRRKRELPRVAREALRQGYRCWHCHKLMRVSGDPNHPRYWTEEHVIPISQGGTDDDVNVVAACRGCNSRRAADGPIQLGIDRDGG